MADGRHLGKIEKSPYLSNGLTDRHKLWHCDAKTKLSLHFCASEVFDILALYKADYYYYYYYYYYYFFTLGSI